MKICNINNIYSEYVAGCVVWPHDEGHPTLIIYIYIYVAGCVIRPRNEGHPAVMQMRNYHVQSPPR